MEPTKVLVLGTACGYDEPLLRPFIRSTLRALPAARIVLFVDDAITGYGDRVESRAPRDRWIRDAIRKLPPGQQPRACRLSRSIGMALAGRDVRNRSRSRLITACYHYAIVRYFWYLDCLDRPDVGGFTHVIISDTRDLIIQRDPFDSETARSVMSCGEEPLPIGECPVNRGWYESLYGPGETARNAGRKALCSGFTMGPMALMKDYLAELCDHMLSLGPRLFLYSGLDQAAHNHLLYTAPIGRKFVFEKANGTRIATISSVGACGLRFADDGIVRDPAGTSVAVVHQYDRHAALKAAIEDAYRDLRCS